MCFSEVFQLRDELNGLGEDVSDEHLTTIILDALLEEVYSIIKNWRTRDPS